MKIAFYGNFKVHFCSEVHHAKTLRKLGHEVIEIQEPEVRGENILNIAGQCDLFIWIHTHGWETQGMSMKEVLSSLKAMNIPTITYHLDLWLGIDRQKDMMKDDYWYIDYFFTVDKLMANWLNKNTKTKGIFMPAGVFEDECIFYENSNKQYLHDIIFTGSYGYHPEWPWRKQLIDWLHKTYGKRFKRYGNPDKDDKNAVVIRGTALNRLYAQSKIVIGDTLCKDFNYPYYSSDRLFEVTGRGGFCLYPYIKGIEKWFKLGNELQTFKYGDFAELKKLIDFWLDKKNEISREKIRKSGFSRTKNNHTYTHRWKEILEILKEDKVIK